MRKLRAGVIGLGYIGASHIESIRRLGFAELAGVADVNYAFAAKKADALGIEHVYQDVDALLSDPGVDIVHNCTPNNLHAELNERILKAGKHLLSEKPLARTSEETGRLVKLSQGLDLAAGVNFNYRMNPMVQDLRGRVKRGELGDITLVHGCYLQDWLLYDTDYNWRIEPEVCGASRCVADIGSHWMDAVQHVTGQRITEVCADLKTVIPVRRKALTQTETFSSVKPTEYEEKTVRTEDWGAVLLHMDGGASGVFYVSEVSAGHGCFFNFELSGTKASAAWKQEECDRLWLGYRDRDNVLAIRNPNNISPEARAHTSLAMGHPEGWNDAFTNNLRAFYTYVRDKYLAGQDVAAPPFATFSDAHQIVRLTEAILESHRIRGWVTLA
ncbi:MAG: Gfo/Idh/MocA family oxidoreductase [Clostridiales bacterium]|jgi:predicted dehydrogenase|nr:Gfo/Idh/MocA family oxidoreductase [Clostridiales bacterium]